MINFISKKKNRTLILFIHGFTGGKKTWSEMGMQKIPDLLLMNLKIVNNFDLAHFDYFTIMSTKIERLKYLFGCFPFGKKRKFKKNLPIDDITDILFSNLEVEFDNYDKVIIIAHSMGGLIAKATILKLIREDKNKIELFLSLCVPHNGANLANFGKLILSNPNVHDLAPLSKIIDETTRGWIDPKIVELLPKTLYFQGKNDPIVPKESSVGYDLRTDNKVFSDDDHTSILSPDENSVVIKTITNAILDSLKKKDKAEKRLINADISEESLQILTDKIGNKLGISSVSFGTENFIKDNIPHLAVHISKRTRTVNDILQVKDKSWIALNGLYESGKTQLALLLHQHLNLPTYWINFKDYDEASFAGKLLNSFDSRNLEDLKAKIDELIEGQKKIIVLEDLPKFGISQYTDNVLISFISHCLNKDTTIITTSNHKIAASIHAVLTDQISEVEIPPMSREESLEVLATYPESFEFELKDVIHDITQGYPIYLQVVCRFLQNRNWNIEHDELIGFFSGTLFTELTDQTLSRFISKVEDPQTRDLLYRLNIIKTAITEKEIKVVAETNPEIERPFEKLNLIVGTWLQRNLDEILISPLLKRLSVQNLSQPVFRQASYRLGLALIEKKMLSQYDVKHVINYFKDAERFDNAGFVVLNLLKHCHSQPDYYYNSNLGYYSWYYSTPIPIQMSLMLRLLIRSLQLNMALGRNSEHIDTIIFLRDDLINLVDQALNEKIDVCLPALTLSSSFLREDSPLAIKYFSYYINSYNYIQFPDIAIAEFDQIAEFDNNIVWLLLMTIDDIPAMDQWFANIEQMAQHLNTDNSEQSFLLCDKLFQNFITKESSSVTPDWTSLLRKFQHIYQGASVHNIDILKALAIKFQIKIIAEKIDDIVSSEQLFLKYIDTIKDELGIFLITDELGRQLFYKDQKEKSKYFLLQISEYQAEKYVITKAETLSILARISGETNAEEAHTYIKKAILFVQENIFIDELNYVNFIGEFATSLFLIGQTKSAMVEYIGGYELLLNTFEENDVYINTQLKYGNAIGYLLHIIETGIALGDKFTKPFRGMISGYNNLTDVYFSEKIHLVIFNVIRFYEFENNMTEANKWANKIFDLKDKYDIKIFPRMLTHLLGYFISQGFYDEAIKQQLEIGRLTEQMLETDVSQIENVHEKTIATRIQSKETESVKDKDFELIVFVFKPILYHLLSRVIKEEIDILHLKSMLKTLLDKYGDLFTNQQTIAHLQEILDHYPTGIVESQAIMKYTNEIQPPNFAHVQLFSYLICSLEMDPKSALDTHFKLSECFPIYLGCVTNNILIPFYIEFWQRKIINDTKSFRKSLKLQINLEKVLNLPIRFQLPAIFALIADDLRYDIKDKVWLKDYYEEYGE